MKRRFLTAIKHLDSALPFVFWILLIFGFDDYAPAVATVLCALMHEAGHLIAFALLKKQAEAPSGRIFGFKISYRETLSYKEEVIVSSSGPLTNIIIGLISFCLFKFANGYFLMLGVINMLTAISNLLPLEGYDGYRILHALISYRYNETMANKFLSPLSFFFVCTLTFLSLYLIGKIGQGYFIFFVLFIALLSKIKQLLDNDFL